MIHNKSLFLRAFCLTSSLLPAVFYAQIQPRDSAQTMKNSEIQTVEVIGRSHKNYKSDYSFVATKIAIKNNDLPQTVNTVTKELIKDRNAFQLAEAVRTVSGVLPSSPYNQYNIRGISQNEEGQIINGMRTHQEYFLQPMMANIERVEVMKGAGSITLSSVDPGGSINLVTKKPIAERHNDITLSAGSFNTYRITTDNTGALNKDKTLLYRFNGAYQQAKSFRDYVNNSGILVSPSITYFIGDKTSVNVELIYNELNGTLDRGQPIFGAVAGKTDLHSTPISLNLGSPTDYFKTKDLTIMGNLVYKFSNAITFNTSVMKQSWNEDLQENRTTNAFVPDINGKPIPSLAMMQFIERRQNWSTTNLSSYFNFKFSTGNVKHQTLLGYDFHGWEKLIGGYQNAARGFMLKNGSVASSFDPKKASDYQTFIYNAIIVPKPNVTPFDLTPGAANIRNSESYIFNAVMAMPSAYTTTNSAYVQHLATWNRLNILTGIRHEWFKDITNYKANGESSYKNNAFVYRFGVNYGITDNINVYGTYLTGFQPQSNTVSLMPNTGSYFGTAKSAAIWKPLTSDLVEFGVKSDFFKNALSINVAVYNINQNNILISANNPAQPDEMVQRGADRSRGFEAEIVGRPLKEWSLFASYSYIDAIIKNDTNPALIGLRKENTSKNSANLWTRYNFEKIHALKDFGVGFGLQYQGAKIPWFTRSFEVPAFTVLDGALYYAPKDSALQIALNVNNIANKTYWVGAQNYLRLFPGAPRNYMLSATFKF